jgi:uncharacterized repeat protein (TIGR01451 family)
MNALLMTALMPMLASEGTMPPPPPSPLLFVRFVAPDGTQVTVRPGAPDARQFPTPAVAGFRLGYGYRVLLSHLPEMPADATLCPSLEIISTLHIPPGLRAEDFPATVQFTIDDIRLAAAGGLVTKVIYLEDPMQAPAVNSTPVTPVEFDVFRGHDPLEEARALGRPMAIVRLGGRDVPLPELAAVAIQNTVLAMGDKGFGPPAAPPTLPRPLFQWFDPILGPKKPLEEILPDGGDIGPRIGMSPEGTLGNVNMTDTAAEFRYGLAPKRISISNRVCLFSPRFAVLRAEIQPISTDLIIAPAKAETAIGQLQLVNRVVNDTIMNAIAPRGLHSKLGVRGIQSRQGVASLDKVIGVMATGTVEGVAVTTGTVEVETAVQLSCCFRSKPAEPLCLTKYADPKAPNVGDVVTFMLHYENVGAKPIHEIVIVDSLATRFEYIPGSNQSDRPVAFTIETTSNWSTVLRWAVPGDLMPGQGGTLKFQARVR